ncbi:hypothetical protein MRX96_011633 [Rhipicephalus microplus]
MPDEQFGRHFCLSKATVFWLRYERYTPHFFHHRILPVVGGRRGYCRGDAARGQHLCAACDSSDRQCWNPQQVGSLPKNDGGEGSREGGIPLQQPQC